MLISTTCLVLLCEWGLVASWCEFCVHGVGEPRFKASHSFNQLLCAFQSDHISTKSDTFPPKGNSRKYKIQNFVGHVTQFHPIWSLKLSRRSQSRNISSVICEVGLGGKKRHQTPLEHKAFSTGSQIWQIAANLRQASPHPELDLQANFGLPHFHIRWKSLTTNAVEHIHTK